MTMPQIVTIVLVHVGLAPFPPHLKRTLAIIRKIAPRSNLILLCSEAHTERHLADIPPGCALIPIEAIPRSEESITFEHSSSLSRDFRDGFWYATTSRFFVLADFIRHFELENVIHIENDVLLYFDPTDQIDAFIGFSEFAVPLDRIRAIAGIVWLANPTVAQAMVKHMLGNLNLNDMDSLGSFCKSYSRARPLPTIPRQYAVDNMLDHARYTEGLECFGGVFDAAAIGQYIRGVDWHNEANDSRFFINESSDLDLSKIDIAWNVRNGARSISLGWKGERTNVLSIHAHSKDMLSISPYNHGVPSEADQIVTGERLQALTDLTISVKPVTDFHGRENIRSREIIEISQHESGAFYVPDQSFINVCMKAKLIFVYTHLLPYFKAYIAPRLTGSYRLILHNSDHGIGFDDIKFLDNPMLEHCWAQNCEISHAKLSPLPIGLANQQWGSENIYNLFEVSRKIEKVSLLYVNLGQTHQSRQRALEEASKVKGATLESGLDYRAYLLSLASHKFCICPRGNGLDTHRFWESLYLDVIPIIIKDDWTSAYSSYPVLMIDDWSQLSELDLNKEYIRIKATGYSFDRLFMGFYRSIFGTEFTEWTLK